MTATPAPTHASPLTLSSASFDRPIRILLLGAGFASLQAYRALVRQLGPQISRGVVQLTLVNPLPVQVCQLWTGEVLAGQLTTEHRLTPLDALFGQARLELGLAVGADLKARAVTVRRDDGSETQLAYDHLLIGTGARDPLERVPGVQDHAWRLRDNRDLERLAAQLDRFDECQASTPANPATETRSVVVIGGGLAGVEMAAALAERRRRVGGGVSIRLVTRGPELLPELRPRHARLADYAACALAQAGVQVQTGSRATEVTAYGVQLAGGEFIRSDLTLFAAGGACAVLPGTKALPRDRAGRLLTDATLRVQGQTGVWAGGDVARVSRPGGECPGQAMWASAQGQCIGENIARSLRGRPLRRFRAGVVGQSAALGRMNAITEVRGLRFTGAAGWLLRLALFGGLMPRRLDGVQVALELLGARLPRRGRERTRHATVAGD